MAGAAISQRMIDCGGGCYWEDEDIGTWPIEDLGRWYNRLGGLLRLSRRIALHGLQQLQSRWYRSLDRCLTVAGVLMLQRVRVGARI